MRRETHLAALKMASKVALSASVLACTASASTPISATPAAESTSAAPAAPEKASCEKVVDQAFPTEGDYPGKKQNVSPEVVACCREILLKHEGSAAHRWDCCANVNQNESHELRAACTPWGPPTPPAMIAGRGSAAQGVLDLRDRARSIALRVPSIPSLEAAAIATWRGRMVNEYASSSVFAALAGQLADAGIDAHEVAQFAEEERRHGVLCGAVVEALGGDACGGLPIPEYPLHPDAHSTLEAVLRNVLSICCLSETVAVALIGAERVEMPDGELRDLLTTIWADEVGHARFGWRLLEEIGPSLDSATRDRLGDYLEVAFAHLVEHELAHLPVSSEPPPEGAIYGLCSGRDARALFFDTVETVIVPGLEAYGLGAKQAWVRALGRISVAAA